MLSLRFLSVAASVCSVVLIGCNSGAVVPPTSVASVPTITGQNVDSGGPAMSADHWHGAYGVFVCGKFLPVIDGSSLPDPDGIHTHDDGLIHIHPFTERASGANAVLKRFTDVLGMALTKTSMKLSIASPPVNVKNGDKCPDGRKGVVRVLEYSGDALGTVKEVKNPLELRFAPNQILVFAFGPKDEKVPPPDSVADLDSPLDALPNYTLNEARKALIGPEPTVKAPISKPTKLVIEDLEPGTGDPAGLRDKVGLKYLLVNTDGKTIDTNWAGDGLLSFPLGRGAVIEGFDNGIVGMKVGGLRKLTVPSDLAYGAAGSPPSVGPNETLVFVIRLVVLEPPRFSVPPTTFNT